MVEFEMVRGLGSWGTLTGFAIIRMAVVHESALEPRRKISRHLARLGATSLLMGSKLSGRINDKLF